MGLQIHRQDQKSSEVESDQGFVIKCGALRSFSMLHECLRPPFFDGLYINKIANLHIIIIFIKILGMHVFYLITTSFSFF